ncbi:MAG TPA: hypothetical protein VFU46_09580 [Gemmatimonadales bacterium]|nr:hypothetical protein [Gemmatimonadales bacterium]
MVDWGWSVIETMRPQILLEIEAPDRWLYMYVDDDCEVRLVTRDEWEALFRPGPEDQS